MTLLQKIKTVARNRRKTLAKERQYRAGAKRQIQKYKDSGAQGHLERAKKLQRRAEALKNVRLDRRARQLRLLRHFRRLKARAQALTWSEAWGGSKGAAQWIKRTASESEAVPPISSLKRAKDHPLSIDNPGSDHNKANTQSYAVDFATNDGAAWAIAMARSIGWTSYTTGSYNSFTWVTEHGTFRVQILWGVSGHWNHVHLGIKRVS